MSKSIEEIIKDVEHIKDCCGKGLPWHTTLCEAIAMLKTHQEAQPNEPLTFDELREMDGQPVWDTRLQVWGLVDLGMAIVVSKKGDIELNIAAAEGRLYRRPPKEETT